ncbi:MAG: hypothetical protein JO029_03275 [Candidatus Eremiobacteraeota bacterium]|nr:hypothetical protein [Candidatus Eremiobacteraeota bacterium]MBV8721318.1 hypothetical protein [Candidatus Eremiobacteraeota bacterium]
MNRSFALAAVVVTLVALLVSGAARAQEPVPTPTPNPLVYSDPAMNFMAPPGAVLVGRRDIDVRSLSDDLQVVARWALHAGKEDARFIDLAMESFEAAPNQWEPQFESQVHNSGDGILVKNKEPMALLNGMPATFVEITMGNGFDSRKEYAVVWADGVRGISLSLTTRIGDVTKEEAKQLLRNATATRYPVDQP